MILTKNVKKWKRIAYAVRFLFMQKGGKNMNVRKRIIGVFFIILSISALFVWEKWGKEQFSVDSVLTLQENLPRGTIIEKNMLTAMKVDTNQSDCLKPCDEKNIIGKETACFVHKGVPLFNEYFLKKNMNPHKEQGEYILSLSAHWIDSVPETIKIGDNVYLYGMDRKIATSKVTYIGEARNIEIIADENEIRDVADWISKGNKLVITYN